MQNKNLWIGIAVVVVIVAALVWYFSDTSTNPFPVSSEDHLTSWALPLPQDAASSTPIKQAEIVTLSKMIGQGQFPDDDIYTGIANDYVLMGDGKSAYKAYEHAIEASSTNALVYDNLGGLFARLYATSTAMRAYAKAVALSPSQLLFQLSYLDYLAQTEPKADTTAAAFVNAKQLLGATNPNLLIAEANWLGAIGSTTAAIADWREVLKQEPGNATAINARIQQLMQQK